MKEENSLQPKKSLGQNFLTSEGALDAVLKAAEVQKGEVILEIGPGKGALTKRLLDRGVSVISIEKDRRLIPFLAEKFSQEIETGRLKVVEGDALTIDVPAALGSNTEYKIVANIPYYITGAFLRKYLELGRKPSSLTVLVQKEVAERIVSKDGKGSLLSISVKTYGIPSIKGIVKRGSFFPAPNVDSAILHIRSISSDFFESISEDGFFSILKSGFSQKRKLLKRNLENVAAPDAIRKAFKHASIPETARAEEVTLDEWRRLASELQ